MKRMTVFALNEKLNSVPFVSRLVYLVLFPWRTFCATLLSQGTCLIKPLVFIILFAAELSRFDAKVYFLAENSFL